MELVLIAVAIAYLVGRFQGYHRGVKQSYKMGYRAAVILSHRKGWRR